MSSARARDAAYDAGMKRLASWSSSPPAQPAFAPAAVASPTVRLTIVHVVQGCHVWGTVDAQPTRTERGRFVVQHGTQLEIRINCPMSFDFSQLSGPKLALGDAAHVSRGPRGRSASRARACTASRP